MVPDSRWVQWILLGALLLIGISGQTQSLRRTQSLFRNDRCARYCYECFSAGPGNCDQCLDGYLLDTASSRCLPICSDYCANCDTIGPGSCNVCKDGFHLPTARSKSGKCSPDTPAYGAAGFSFQDIDPVKGNISGTMVIKSPGADRENSTHYAVYLGNSQSEVREGTSSVAVGPMAGNGSDTLLPIDKVKISSAKYLLVYTSHLGALGPTPVALPIEDFSCPDRCTTCAYNSTKRCDQCDPGFLYQEIDPVCYPTPPKIKAKGAVFVDERLKSGEIGGVFRIFAPANEQGITHYAVHWGIDRGVRMTSVPSFIVRLPVKGKDLSWRMPITAVPDGAAYFLVYSENSGSFVIESEVAVMVKDEGQYNDPRGFTVAGTPQSHTQLWELGSGSEGSGADQLNLPSDVVVDDDIYIADMGNHRVQRFPLGSYSGMSASTVLKAHGKETLYPASMQVLQNAPGQKASESLMVLSSSTKKLFYVHLPIMNNLPKVDIAVESSGADGFVSPEGLKFFGSALYVADTGNHRVRLFRLPDTQGYTVAGGLGAGSGLDQLKMPRHVFVAQSADGVTQVMYIADTLNHRIMKVKQPDELSLNPGKNPGVVVAGGNGAGNAASQLFEPSGIYVTADRTIYIADSGNFRVQRWPAGSTEGFTVVGGVRGTSATQLTYPRRVLLVNHDLGIIDPRRQEVGQESTTTLYVVDSGNHRVQRFPAVTAFTSRCTLGSPCEVKVVINRPDVLVRLSKGDQLRIVPFEDGTSCGVDTPACQPVQWHGVDNPNAIGKLAGNAVLRASHQIGSGIEGPIGQFRMCWGPKPDKKTTVQGCALTPIDMGIFVMQGPKAIESECTLGIECIINLKGVGLRKENRLAMRMPAEDSALVWGNGCRASWFDTVGNKTYWPWPIKALEPFADAEGDPEEALQFRFSAGLTGPVGRKFLLCWSDGWGENQMLDIMLQRRPDRGLQYDVRVGTLAMIGPIRTTVRCYVFEECSFTIRGVGLQKDNGLLLTRHRCGNDWKGQDIEGLDNPSTPAKVRTWGSENPPESELTFNLGVVLSDRFYGNCSICWSHSGIDPLDMKIREEPESYKIDTGEFILLERGADEEYGEPMAWNASRNSSSNETSSVNQNANPATTSAAFSALKSAQALHVCLAIIVMIFVSA